MPALSFVEQQSRCLRFGAAVAIHGEAGFLVEIRPESICAEVGVWKGDFSAQILHFGAPTELHLVDPWRFNEDFPTRWYGGALARDQGDTDGIYDQVRRRFQKYTNVKVHRLRSVDAAALFADTTFDWVYVDGDHSMTAVEADIGAWLPKVKADGALIGDDYDWRDETAASRLL